MRAVVLVVVLFGPLGVAPISAQRAPQVHFDSALVSEVLTRLIPATSGRAEDFLSCPNEFREAILHPVCSLRDVGALLVLTFVILGNTDVLSAPYRLGGGDLVGSPWAREFLDRFGSARRPCRKSAEPR